MDTVSAARGSIIKKKPDHPTVFSTQLFNNTTIQPMFWTTIVPIATVKSAPRELFLKM
jgi:hypothetical protein